MTKLVKSLGGYKFFYFLFLNLLSTGLLALSMIDGTTWAGFNGSILLIVSGANVANTWAHKGQGQTLNDI
jgi:hypothetical protein